MFGSPCRCASAGNVAIAAIDKAVNSGAENLVIASPVSVKAA
jgi:hypothetical protein